MGADNVHAIKGERMYDTGSTTFMLICTMLVFLMTPGLAFFYGGLSRRKNVINTMLMCFGAIGLVGVLWIVAGWSLAYGGDGSSPFIGGLDQLLCLPVLNQVLLHQSVIGLETKTALDKLGVKPDIIIGCAGGGSNLGGLISPFMGEKLRGERDYRFIAVEPASCPSLTRGRYAYDFCDTGKVCPLAKMYTLGSGFIPSPNHAGGLRYHGMSSIVSQLYHDGYMEARSVEQTKVFEAAEQFARIEGILPAPESSHAIRVAIDEAVKCRETGEAKTIVFGLTGTGYFDMVAYEKFYNGEMRDFIPTDAQLAESFASLPQVPGLDE